MTLNIAYTLQFASSLYLSPIPVSGYDHWFNRVESSANASFACPKLFAYLTKIKKITNLIRQKYDPAKS